MLKNAENSIVSSPEIRGGRPRIANTSITVHRIATWYNLGYSPEEITAQYDHLSLSAVFAALSYYFSHQESIDEEIELDRRAAKKIEADLLNSPANP